MGLAVRSYERLAYSSTVTCRRLFWQSARYLVNLVGFILAVSVIASAYAAELTWPPADGQGHCKVTKEANARATMRDGTVLFADVYRPATSEPVPVILMRTQYGKDGAQMQPFRFQSPTWFASQCYIVVIQDIRGQYASRGDFYEYAHDRNDGYDSVEWAAHLPGSNGAVGMYGSSYVGATQWLAATTSPPSLKTIVPSNTASDYYDGWTYEGGAFRLDFVEGWMMKDIVPSAAANRGDSALAQQLKSDYTDIAKWVHFRPYLKFPPFQPENDEVAKYYFDAIRHSSYDAYWKQFSIKERYPAVKVPVLAFEGWYDAFLQGGLENFVGMTQRGGSEAARKNQRIVIGPWEHVAWGRPGATYYGYSAASPRLAAIGPVANSPVNELMLAWFDHFLKGKDNGIDGGPRVDYFTMGENRWHVAPNWPLPGTDYQTWYLGSGGHAASLVGDGVLSLKVAPEASPADHFIYNPSDPVPSVGGHSCCEWYSDPQGQFNQVAVEQRSDVLIYTSPVLTEAMDITGPISVVLYAASSAHDTDFTAKLVDVYPDGQAVNLNNGIIRARFRDSLSQPSLIVPGQAYKYTIAIWPTSNLFQPGHRIRLEISSSDFPQFDPNPNTGEPFGTSDREQTAQQTILHDSSHPSALILPVIPAAARSAGADAAPLL